MATTSKKPNPRVRKNVTLHEDVIKQGHAVQAADKRASFSNMVGALIQREHERLFPELYPKAVAKDGLERAA